MDKTSTVIYVVLTILIGVVVYNAYAQAHGLPYDTAPWVRELIRDIAVYTICGQIIRTAGGMAIPTPKEEPEENEIEVVEDRNKHYEIITVEEDTSDDD